MAESITQPNNKAVVFKGRPQREMTIGELPRHIRRAAKRGLISDKQMKRLGGD